MPVGGREMQRALRITVFAAFNLILIALVGLTDDESFHDRRERLVQYYTLEWNQTLYRRLSLEYINSINTLRLQMRNKGWEVPLIDTVRALSEWVEQVNYWTIKNSPRMTKIECTLQYLSLVADIPRSSEYFYYDMFIINKGIDNKEFLVVNYGLSRQKAHSVDYSLFSWRSEHRRSIPLPVDLTALIFINGVSPFRAWGTEFSKWRLENLTPEMWMFKLEIPEQEMEVILHLSRNHHDAPAKLEVIKPREKYTYETRRYTLIDGIWFPAVVECKTHTSVGHTKATYVLLKAEKNQLPLQLPELPGELPVRQWHERPALSELTIDETTTSTVVNVPASIKWGDLKKNIEKTMGAP